jgi:hypothetical protein
MYIHGRLSEQFSGSHEAFGTTFSVTGGYRKAMQNKLTFFEFANLSVASRNFILDFPHRKTVKNGKSMKAHSKI